MNEATQFLAIPLFKVFMPESVMPMLQETLLSGYIGEGSRVVEFESALARWLGVQGVVAVNSGTSALHLALRLAGVGGGDEVVSTPLTCVATNTPILALGARVVWADIDPWTGNVSVDDVARKCTPKTKAIVVVHWGGLSVRPGATGRGCAAAWHCPDRGCVACAGLTIPGTPHWRAFGFCVLLLSGYQVADHGRWRRAGL
jgi:hypothetical protein